MTLHLPALEVINAIPLQPQTQVALHAQLISLWEAANRLGLHDAADYLRRIINNTEARIREIAS